MLHSTWASVRGATTGAGEPTRLAVCVLGPGVDVPVAVVTGASNFDGKSKRLGLREGEGVDVERGVRLKSHARRDIGGSGDGLDLS